MSVENQYMEEVGDTAPKPSDVRRAGKINYARQNRNRSGFNPPAMRRMTAAQQRYAETVRRQNFNKPQAPAPRPAPEPVMQPPPVQEPTPEPEPVEQPVEEVDDDAIENLVNQMAEEVEEKKVDTPDPEPEPAPEAILDDKMFGYDENLASTSQEKPHDLSTIQENQEKISIQTIEKQPSDEKPEEPVNEPVVPQRRRVYHRPHTNQTVVLGSKPSNDESSTASGLSQPSWTGRQMKSEEEEDDEELSQTSVGNSKRRARMARRKKRSEKPESSSTNSGNAGNFGAVVSQAFDSLLGYGGGQKRNDDDGYSTDGTENVVNDWQEAILTTLGCTVPHGMSMRTSDTFDDTTVESNRTGGQSQLSNHSSVRHVRTGSNLSGSVFSAYSGGPTGVGSILSFETTEELADFSKDKNGKQNGGNYKVPDAYDATPPSIPRSKSKEGMYSEDLYSTKQSDFEPVDLLAEGESLMESVGKDILTVANAKASEAMTAIQGFLNAPPTAEEMKGIDATAETAEPAVDASIIGEAGALLNALSNITEPLTAIKENDVETPSRTIPTETKDENAFEAFESFEDNVFQAAKAEKEAESAKPETELPEDLEIKETESEASLFQGIDDEEPQPKDLLPEVEPSQEVEPSPEQEESPVAEDDGVDSDAVVKVSLETQPKAEEASPSIPNQDTDTTATSTEKASTDSIAVDREDASAPAEPIKEKAASVSPPKVEKPEVTMVSQPKSLKTSKKVEKTSFEAAVKAPETKKKKKFSMKGLFGRSKKNKKGSKKSSKPLAAMTEKPTKDLLSKSTPEKPVEPSAPEPEVEPQVEESPVIELAAPSGEEVKELAAPSGDQEVKEIAAPSGEQVRILPAPSGEEEEVAATEEEQPLNSPAEETDSEEVQAPSEAISCPTTPVRAPEAVENTPKMSNLGLEDRTLTRPVSGANLADLPGIDEKRSFREDPPAKSEPVLQVQPDPPTDDPLKGDSFGLSFQSGGHVAGFGEIQNEKEISFESFGMDLEMNTWESFGDNSEDLGHAAFQQKALEDANKSSPQKVSAFPVC